MIDTGVVKARTHHPMTGLDMLRVEKISQAQAWQRAGRAARESPGRCYRAYTREEFDKMKNMPVPEIQRCSLAGVALQLLAIGVDITTFDFMDKPPKEGVDVAVKCLEKLGAVKGTNSSCIYTFICNRKYLNIICKKIRILFYFHMYIKKMHYKFCLI